MSEGDDVTIMAVGDIMTGCGYFHSLVGDSIPSMLSDPDKSLLDEEVSNQLRGADLTFGNLECVVSEGFDVDSEGIPPRLMGPVETIPLLERAGFDVLNVANNHILDHGPEYVVETMDLLEKHGIDHIGNPLEEHDPLTYSLKGRDVTIDGYYVPDLGDDAKLERIRSNLPGPDDPDHLTIVSLHWGVHETEHMRQPSPDQVSFGRDLVDNGADVILGHHSHTFQPVERYGAGVIAYSLGNFVFDMWRERNRKSGILKIVAGDEIRVSILPTEQVDYRVGFTDEKYIRDVQNTPVTCESAAAYRAASTRIRRRHKFDVIRQFMVNFHRFPPEYHVSTYRRWLGKAKRELRASSANIQR